MTNGLVFGCATLAIAGGYYLLAAALPESQLADAVGPGGLPSAYALVLAALSLLLIGQSLAASRGAVGSSDRLSRPEGLWRAAGTLANGAVYVLVVPWLGYVVSLAGLIAVTTYVQGGGTTRRVWLTAVVGALFFWFLFVWVLRVPHPAGWWTSLFQ